MGGKVEAGISLAMPTRAHCPVCCALERWEPAASEVEHFLLDPHVKEAAFVILLNEWYSPSPWHQESANHLSWSLPGWEMGNVSGSSSLDLPPVTMSQLPVASNLRHTGPESRAVGPHVCLLSTLKKCFPSV